MSLRVLKAFYVVALLGSLQIAIAQAEPQASSKSTTARPLSEKLYSGWRASRLLGSPVFSKKGLRLGDVRNVIVADNGQIEALVAEEAGVGTRREFVFRLPWAHVVKPVRPGIVLADLSDPRSAEFGLFPPTDNNGKNPHSFLISEVLGDYARLQTGQGYGYVSDVVFNQDGGTLAVLIARESFAGGGTFAFPFPGEKGRWEANMSYYGLPFVTSEQANAAGLRVHPRKFEDSGSG